VGGRDGIGDGDADRLEDGGNVQAGNQTVRVSAAVQVIRLLRLSNRSLIALGLPRVILS